MIRLAAGALLATLVSALGSCAGSEEPIRIGVLSVCRGAFAPFYDSTLAGAELPLLRRGAELAGPNPADGVSGAEVAGRSIDLHIACSDDTGERALAEARRLVEQEHVDVLVGPVTTAGGIAVSDYARTMPAVAFVNGSSPALEITLKRGAPNLFRFSTNAVQWSAGLGTYAYRTLGWRTAAVLGTDFAYHYDEAAGFIAEFCALGGSVSSRTWIPLGARDVSRRVKPLLAGKVDGYFITTLISPDLGAIVEAIPGLEENLSTDAVLGAAAGGNALELGAADAFAGAVSAGPTPYGSTAPGWTLFQGDLNRAFPELRVAGLETLFFNAMEGTLRALEAIDGDLGEDGADLLTALAETEFDGPGGHVRLDPRHQAVGSNHLLRVEDSGGALALNTFLTIPKVDDSYGGRFTPTRPLPDRTSPPCTRGNPPAWARG